jgi:glycosyltransferase involved in cell wall biosynthesis
MAKNCQPNGIAQSAMRILYSHRVQSKDGMSVHIEELIRALREAGHEVRVVGPGFYDQAGFGGESRTVELIRRVLPGAAQELAELGYNVLAYRRLARAWAEFRPDVIYERCNLFYLAGARLARRTGTRLLLEVNAPLAAERHANGGLRLYGLARRLEVRTWRAAYRVLPVTAVLGDMLAEAGVAREAIVVIANGVDLSRFPPRPAKGAGEPVALGFVGFVRDWHGLDTVIAGMAASRTACTLTIVGDGPARAGLERLAGELGIGAQVAFTGVVSPEAVAAVVSGFDIALQPKATAYASPLKIFDYMAAACAIVAPDQANIREVLRDGENAVLFDAGSPGAMWRAVEALIGDAGRRSRLGAAARAAVEAEGRTWGANAARVVELARSAE